tara:strand:- start:2203 stop:2448 length:246 start_codon:yes stop_codon:yes gene_type:complete
LSESDDDVKAVAQEQAEEAYRLFLKFAKFVGWGSMGLLLIVASCNFGVDGTGSKGNPELYEEYKENMLEMQERIKKEKYGE